MIAEAKIPNDDAAFDARKYDDQRGEVGGFGATAGCKVEIKQRIVHDGEVHRYVFTMEKRRETASLAAIESILRFSFGANFPCASVVRATCPKTPMSLLPRPSLPIYTYLTTQDTVQSPQRMAFANRT